MGTRVNDEGQISGLAVSPMLGLGKRRGLPAREVEVNESESEATQYSFKVGNCVAP